MTDVQTPSTWVGVDVSKKKFDVYFERPDGRGKSKVFPNAADGFAALLAWGRAQGVDWTQTGVCLEATGPYGTPLARALHEAGVVVAIENPARIQAFARLLGSRVKTDRADARLIARYARQHPPRRWIPPSAQQERLHALVSRLDDLLVMRTMEQARAQQLHGEALRSVENVLKALEDEIARLRDAIRDPIDRDPDLRHKAALLESIPGIGQETLSRVLAYLGPLERFERVRQAVAYAGLNPRVRQSGQWTGASPISKQGSSAIRKALYMPALVAKRHNPVLRTFCERLAAKGKRPKQVVVAAMRKLVHLMWGVLKSGRPFDPAIGLP
jgi:transposase